MPSVNIAPPAVALLFLKQESLTDIGTDPSLEYIAPPFLAELFTNNESVIMKLELPWAYNAPPLLTAAFSLNIELTIFTVALFCANIAPPRFLSSSVDIASFLTELLTNVELTMPKVAPENIPTPPHGLEPEAKLFINSEFIISIGVDWLLKTPPKP